MAKKKSKHNQVKKLEINLVKVFSEDLCVNSINSDPQREELTPAFRSSTSK